MHPSLEQSAPRRTPLTFCALLCAAFIAAGCHHNNLDSGYGIAWVTLTDQPGDFTSYIVNVDSVTLTRNDGAVVTALATAETVDLTKLKDISELWGTATIPNGTYISASIILDYTNAVISVLVNGAPQKATVVGPGGAAVTTVTVNVILDPANQLTVVPTTATASAQRLAIDFNLAASTASINTTTSPPTVTVRPFFTAGIAPPDNKLIRVRGPLINSDIGLGTYTVYVRPFRDEVSSLGSLTLFNSPATIYNINGVTSVGSAGLSQLSQSSAGTTMTAAYTTYEPTLSPAVAASAAKFNTKYVIAGSTLEDFYTAGLDGDVIARSGNTLTLRGSTLFQNALQSSSYNTADAVVTVGPATIVTADDNAASGLNYNSIAVGQHVAARGIYSLPASGVVTLDATGTATNTGSVRLISTQVVGTLISSTAGSVDLNLQTINDWPANVFTFTGNGTSAATDTSAAHYLVNTGSLALPAAIAGDTLWVDGITAPFGAAPPDFNAYAINSEASTPASLQVSWTGTGTHTPFSAISSAGLTINLSNANFSSAVLRLGSAMIPLASLAGSPLIVPQAAAASSPGLPPVFTPLFAVGDPTAVAPAGINVYSVFSSYVTQLTTVLGTTAALQLEARGTYNRATNTFTANSINVVL